VAVLVIAIQLARNSSSRGGPTMAVT